MPLAKAIMIQGTASNVGKSVVTAAFCRMLRNRGHKVAPFKAQNMSNNSYVTLGGGEIGRAQAAQAEACGVEPTVLMNPILLKPDTDMQAQVIAMGKPVLRVRSIGQKSYQKRFKPVVESALNQLRSEYEYVVIEGAGSPAEMNLKERDIVNMSVAKMAKASVVLVGDIDWGGIFAQLVGTYNLFDKDEKKLVKAFLINKFRGDKKILDPGLDWIEKRTHKKILGVLPYISDLEIAEEDSISSEDSSHGLRNNTRLDSISGKGRDRRTLSIPHSTLLVDVLWLPRISNFTDFDALKKEKDVHLRYLHEPDRRSIPDLVIIPGTKSTIADLKFLHKTGLADYIKRCVAFGVPILGICGGYQMLGKTIKDPDHVESKEDGIKGLGLLPGMTTYLEEKTTLRVKAKHIESGFAVDGYEIHMGRTRVARGANPLFQIGNRSEGIVMPNKVEGKNSWIAGTYLHGLFDQAKFRRYFLNQIRRLAGLQVVPSTGTGSKQAKQGTASRTCPLERVDVYDHLAKIVEKNIDQKIFQCLIDA